MDEVMRHLYAEHLRILRKAEEAKENCARHEHVDYLKRKADRFLNAINKLKQYT